MNHEILTECPRLTDGTSTGWTLPHVEGTYPAGSLVAMTGFQGRSFPVRHSEIIKVRNAETGRIWLAIRRENKIVELSHLQQF